MSSGVLPSPAGGLLPSNNELPSSDETASLGLPTEPMAVFDRLSYPDIFDIIIATFLEEAPHNALLYLRATCTEMRDRVDKRMVRHVIMYRNTKRIDFATAIGKRIPRENWTAINEIAGQVKVPDLDPRRPVHERSKVDNFAFGFYGLRAIRNHGLAAKHVNARSGGYLEAGTAIYFAALTPGDQARQEPLGWELSFMHVNIQDAHEVCVNYLYLPKHRKNNLAGISIPLMDPVQFHPSLETAVMLFTAVDQLPPVLFPPTGHDAQIPSVKVPFLDILEDTIMDVYKNTEVWLYIVGLDDCNSWFHKSHSRARKTAPSAYLRSQCVARLLDEYPDYEEAAEEILSERVKFLSGEQWRAQVGEEKYAMAAIPNARCQY